MFFFKQKTAYELRISDWSSDVCSSDLLRPAALIKSARGDRVALKLRFDGKFDSARFQYLLTAPQLAFGKTRFLDLRGEGEGRISREGATLIPLNMRARRRSEEHTSELQSLMRSQYAVFCLKQNTS